MDFLNQILVLKKFSNMKFLRLLVPNSLIVKVIDLASLRRVNRTDFDALNAITSAGMAHL